MKPAAPAYRSRRCASRTVAKRDQNALPASRPTPVAKAPPVPAVNAPPPDAQAGADARTALEVVVRAIAQAYAQAGADAAVEANAQKWAQAGADAAVQYLADTGRLREGRPVILKSVIRDQAGFIVGSIEEQAEILDEPTP